MELHHYANFGEIAPTAADIMAIFWFLKMADVDMLDFQNFKLLTIEKVKKVEVHHYAKFRRNCSNRGRNIVIKQYSSASFSKFGGFSPIIFVRAHF